ncbi:MAG: glycosyltransferase family 4 protein [Cyclobacteriaceae bacterium]|nr:glycosyltransferase family 4 protein [Cyclobacteriaceae bacterium]
MKKVLVAHPGTQHAAHLVRELHHRQLLSGFHTCLAWSTQSVTASVLRGAGQERRLATRMLDGIPPALISTYPLLEWRAWRNRRNGMSPNQVYLQRNEAFQQRIPDRALQDVDEVIGFDTSSWLLAQRMQSFRGRFIMEQTIGHPRAAWEASVQVAQQYPDWQQSWVPKAESLIRFEEDEHRLADLIVAPGSFVAETLVKNGVSKDKIRINPFGTDTRRYHPVSSTLTAKPFVFLFVGALSARKGLPVLLNAWKSLAGKNAELWLAGGGQLPSHVTQQLPAGVRILGRVLKSEMPELYRRAHAFVFPSFFEGQSIALIEAAASGLPIIATREAGAAEIVSEGETGYLLPAGDELQLADAMMRLFADRTSWMALTNHARHRAALWSWDHYGRRWSEIIGA